MPMKNGARSSAKFQKANKGAMGFLQGLKNLASGKTASDFGGKAAEAIMGMHKKKK